MKPLPEIRLLPTRPALDARPLAKRVGLIILATDHTSEPDFHRMVASERIGVYVARIPYKNPTTPENLRRMQPELEAAAALILPDEPLDAVCYSCT
ncbi:MAG: ectoine utilization protein EutA, partial [Mesorhizobium sp.]